MGTKSPGGPQRCRLILQGCLAIQLSKPGQTPEDFWMYDSGYMIFQNFLAANAQCWWNAPLTAATRALRYVGHVAPGMLLVTAEPCALEVLRGAFARSVLKPPATFVISSVGDIDDCIVTPTVQGQFTPLPEALCDVIMVLTTQGQSATMENIKVNLAVRFPHMILPPSDIIYDTLAHLMQERKIYQTSKGYFIVTPERRRSRSRPRNPRSYQEVEEEEPQEVRTLLMTNSEALHSLYGEISTERDGDLTHQCIQTNLADVICGGNPNDKILYPRNAKRRSTSFPTPRSLERRHSLKLFGSSKRLQRCASTRSLSKTYAQTLTTTDSSSSEYQSTDSSSPKKGSLLSRLFRRSGRSKQRQIETFSAQFPPPEWFNSRTVHLHSVGTQTTEHDLPAPHTLSNSTFYDGSEISQRSSTLPRRHRRHISSDSTFVISSRDCSPRRRSPAYCSSSLPRSTQSIPITSLASNTNAAPAQNVPQIQSKTNKYILGKHLFEDQNTLRSANKRYEHSNDNKDNYRSSVQSGPSSLESGKASMITSGPSSIDSGKLSLSRTSGHSSLESQSSPSRSILLLNSSPKSIRKTTPIIKTKPAQQEYSSKSIKTNRSSPARKLEESPHITAKPPSGIPNSNSNSSITLQVTTSGNSQNNIPSTKIYVRNSPVKSVITLENGKLMENSNVFIINNETTTNENGEKSKKIITRHHSMPAKATVKDKQAINVETDDSSSLLNDTNGTCTAAITKQTYDSDHVEIMKPSKNVNKDTAAAMNNSRKLSLQMSQNGNSNGNIVYKNLLKNDSNPSSPIENCFESSKQDFGMAGSVGNLRCYEKNTIGSHNKLNSICDLKNLRYESLGNLQKGAVLNSNPAINTDCIAHMLHKNIITVGSEPNLAIKNCEQRQKTICQKSVEKETVDRKLSQSKENCEEFYNFPSLTDLSFNFTSLAAQKILQGVSLNSIDTLVELNMANNKDKQQNNQSPKCTDFGIV